MVKKIITGGLFFGLLMMATPVFAITATAETTVTEVKATPISADVVAKISCVGSAVNIREQAIGAAVTKFNTEFSAAYKGRADMLKNAYALTNAKDVKSAVKNAWSVFNSGIRTSRKNWQAARNAAWAQFKTASAACKAPAGTTDTANVTMEATGN